MSHLLRGTVIHNSENRQRKIHINVGGETHSPFLSTLKNVPDCPLAWIIRNEYRRELDYDEDSDTYFFDRHPGIFTNIMNYFQTGKLHCPRDVCGPMFQDELNYWGIDETQMEACCWPNYTEHREIQKNLKSLRITREQKFITSKEYEENGTYIDEGDNTKWRKYQNVMWEVLDEPYSSQLAKIFAYITLGFIVLSIMTYSLITIDGLRYQPYTKVPKSTENITDKESCERKTYGVQILAGFEILIAIWFSLEIILRFTFCPNKVKFLKTLSNWIDLIAVIPVYLIIILPTNEGLFMLNMVRYLRIFRFFKLLYDLRILGKTLQASMHQMFILLMVLCVPTLIFSSIVYYTENNWGSIESKKDFTEMPEGIWWSVVTMTTVGYGRVTPDSIPGKVIGAAAAIIGILMVSMTATVIATSFQQYYQVAQAQLRIPLKLVNSMKTLQTTKNTLLSRIQKENGKQASIQSDTSKDSGYGRSPVPPVYSDSENLTTWQASETLPSLVTRKRNKNIIIGLGKDPTEGKSSVAV